MANPSDSSASVGSIDSRNNAVGRLSIVSRGITQRDAYAMPDQNFTCTSGSSANCVTGFSLVGKTFINSDGMHCADIVTKRCKDNSAGIMFS